MKLLAGLTLVLTSLSLSVGVTTHSRPVLHLQQIRSITLAKTTGEIDQLIELPNGQLAIRDSTYKPLNAQSIEVYGPSGELVRRIGSYGRGVGQFNALKQIAYLSRDRMIWVVDMLGRISRFDLNGKFISSTLVQKPGFHPYGLALDDIHGRYFLTGCVALHFYLDLGCTMVHQYDLASDTYIRSFLENDPEAVANKYFGLEDVQLAIGPSGLYAIDAPVRKLFYTKVDGKREIFTIPDPNLSTLPLVDPKATAESMARGQYLFQNIVLTDRMVVVSAYRKGEASYLLECLTLTGKPIELGVKAPGALVGSSATGSLWFSVREGSAYKLYEYAIS